MPNFQPSAPTVQPRASAHDKIARTSFGGIEFPGETHTLRGKGRHHIHEYPHQPGGAPEKLGRALYEVTIRGNFQATFPAYPGLYPDSLNKLRKFYEQQLTQTLIHPTVGSFPAFITGWNQVKNARLRSGEIVDIEFLEDQSTAFLTDQVANINPQQVIAASDAQFNQELQAVIASENLKFSDGDMSIFQAINSLVASIEAVKDTSDLYGNLYAANIQRLIDTCQQATNLTSMQDPRSWPLVDILYDMQAAAIQGLNDLQNNHAQLLTYTVPRRMTLVDVAATLYGDASRQSDLLSLNSDRINDPMNIPAGTQIRYYSQPKQFSVPSGPVITF